MTETKLQELRNELHTQLTVRLAAIEQSGIKIESNEALNAAGNAFKAAYKDGAAEAQSIHCNLKPALQAAIAVWLAESGYTLMKN